MLALKNAPSCFHCGEALPDGAAWHARIEERDEPMCCPGCAAVAQGIVDAGLGAYYRTRSSFAAPAPPTPPPAAALPAPSGSGALEGQFSLAGIRCAACVWLIEQRLARLAGVASASVNVASERLLVRWDAALCQSADIVQALREIGYGAWPYQSAEHAARLEAGRKLLFRQLFVAGLCMMQVMMYALPAYIAEEGSMDAAMAALMQWASLLLTVPAVLYSALPFFRGALAGLRARMPGMDLPVAIGIGAAFGASALATVRGQGEVYYDSVTMFIFLLLASRYLELLARRKAARALEVLQRALPASCLRLPHWPASRATETVDVQALREGDTVQVGTGAAFPADGRLVDGAALVDLSLLTGESAPQWRAGEVPGGAVNAGDPVLLRVERPAAASTLANLVRLVQQAGHGKPRLALWADKVGAWFVVALLALTVAVLLAWQMIDPARAWQVAIAVLVVSCPCALSLATPAVLAAATGRLVRLGVLVVQPHVLETLARATHIVFDKTGTLTEGRPRLRRVRTLGDVSEARCRAIAAALESSSQHPLAEALRAGQGGLAAQALRSVPGQGVEGEVDGVAYRLGRAGFAGAAIAFSGDTSVILSGPAGPLAQFELADTLRPEAAAVLRQCRARGLEVILLSGDDAAVASCVGQALGIGRVLGGQLPEQKLAFVQQLQAQGAVVAMVGDGINDAAVLAAADVSFAMGGGAPLAQLHADCVLMADNLHGLGECLSTAARAMRVVRQNLAWATLYNAIAIPAAACGLINPWLSAVGMSVSSMLVVANALRLR